MIDIQNPQVLSILSGFAGVIVGGIITGGLQVWLLGRRIRADERIAERKVMADLDLAERKFAFDKELAEHKASFDRHLADKKLVLDKSFADHKRRQDLAEEVLSGFYQMSDIVRAIRSPASFAGEGAGRPKQPGESEDLARSRDTYYAIYARFENHRKEIADLLSRRYRMSAWFGRDAEVPFDTIQGLLNTIVVSARLLGEWAGDNLAATGGDNAALWRKMQGDIWEGASEPDQITPRLVEAIAAIEAICRPVLQEKAE